MNGRESKIRKAIEKVLKDLRAMSREDLLSEIKQRENGEIACILLETGALEIGELHAAVEMPTWDQPEESHVDTQTLPVHFGNLFGVVDKNIVDGLDFSLSVMQEDIFTSAPWDCFNVRDAEYDYSWVPRGIESVTVCSADISFGLATHQSSDLKAEPDEADDYPYSMAA